MYGQILFKYKISYRTNIKEQVLNLIMYTKNVKKKKDKLRESFLHYKKIRKKYYFIRENFLRINFY